MTDRIFFAIQRGPRGPEPALYHDECRPSAFALSITDYACEVPPLMRGWPLDRLLEEYRTLDAVGKLPANLVRQ